MTWPSLACILASVLFLLAFLAALVFVDPAVYFGSEDLDFCALTGVFFTASIFGKAWMGTLADRFGNMKSIAMCQLANIVGILIVVYSNHFALLVAGVAVLGITNKGSLPAIMSKTSQSVSDSISRNAIGVNQLALGVATTLSPLLYGIVSSYVGSGRLVCLAGIAVNAVALLLASVTGRDSM